MLFPLLSNVLLAARVTCALMMLCMGSLVCGSWHSLGCSSVRCDALAQGLKSCHSLLCHGLAWRCFQQHPVQLSRGDLVLRPSCRGEEMGLAEEEQERAGGGCCSVRR